MAHYQTEGYDCQRSIGYLLRRASLLNQGQLEDRFAASDLTFPQWVVLMQLRDGQAYTASDIARNIGYDSGALTRLIDNLEQRGLLARVRCRDDRRVVKLNLTEAGTAAAQELIPIAVDFYNITLADFTQSEIETLISLLTRLVACLCPARHAPEPSLAAPGELS